MFLAAHGFVCELHPSWGGLVRALRWRAPDGQIRPLLHEAAGLTRTPEGRYPCGLWPMVPFANRAWDGLIRDEGTLVRVPVNEPESGAAIHGFGTAAAWTVEAADDGRATLLHRKEAGEDPYRYAARLAVSLLPGEARFSLSVTNEAGHALPYGLGLHPWFPRSPDTVIAFQGAGELHFHPGGYRAAGVTDWTAGGPFAHGSGLPADRVTAHSVLDWAGEALLTTPSRRLALSITASETARHPVLWCPESSDFVCFEPQSHAIGAPSEAAAAARTPLVRLQPGASFAISMALRPRLLPI